MAYFAFSARSLHTNVQQIPLFAPYMKRCFLRNLSGRFRHAAKDIFGRGFRIAQRYLMHEKQKERISHYEFNYRHLGQYSGTDERRVIGNHDQYLV